MFESSRSKKSHKNSLELLVKQSTSVLNTIISVVKEESSASSSTTSVARSGAAAAWQTTTQAPQQPQLPPAKEEPKKEEEKVHEAKATESHEGHSSSETSSKQDEVIQEAETVQEEKCFDRAATTTTVAAAAAATSAAAATTATTDKDDFNNNTTAPKVIVTKSPTDQVSKEEKKEPLQLSDTISKVEGKVAQAELVVPSEGKGVQEDRKGVQVEEEEEEQEEEEEEDTKSSCNSDHTLQIPPKKTSTASKVAGPSTAGLTTGKQKVRRNRKRKTTLACQWRKNRELARSRETTPNKPGSGGEGEEDESRPVVPDAQNCQDRLRTFESWPHVGREVPGPGVLSEAGFFLEGPDDSVRCFQCGVVQFNWEPREDPWLRHVETNPKCLYLEKVKGRDWIEKACSSRMKQ